MTPAPRLPEEPNREEYCFTRFLEDPREENFREVCLALSPRLMKYFRLKGCGREVAEDMTQEVLLSVYRHYASVRERGLFLAWVYKVARNTLLQSWRRARRKVGELSLEEGAHLTAAGEPSDLDFYKLIAHLDAAEREIVTMRFVWDLDYAEIAEALDIPVGTAKWRVFNCKMKIATRLEKKK